MHTLSPAAGALLLATAVASTLCAAQSSDYAVAIQRGAGNRAVIGQDHNGASATAVIDQYGNNNSAGDPATGAGGIVQSRTSDTLIHIRQMGDANLGAVRSERTVDAGLVALQAGSGNRVDGAVADVQTTRFIVDQTGDGNRAGIAYRNTFNAETQMTQNGNANLGSVDQSDSRSAHHVVLQYGDRNRATVAGSGNMLNYYHIQQGGNDNVATLRQGTVNSYGYLLQYGERNTVTSDQYGASSYFDIDQHGSLNTASMAQNATGLTPWANGLLVRQAGERQQTNIAQTGSGNHGTVLQD